jgi:hypothetical protein
MFGRRKKKDAEAGPTTTAPPRGVRRLLTPRGRETPRGQETVSAPLPERDRDEPGERVISLA